MAYYSSPNSPGDWRSFLKRNDIRNLSLQEQKKKYLIEQLQFEDFVTQSLISLSNVTNAAGNIDKR